MIILNSSQIDEIIAETVPALPEGHTHAIVGTVDQDGLKVAAVMASHNQVWQLRAAFEHAWDGTNSIGAKVIASW